MRLGTCMLPGDAFPRDQAPSVRWNKADQKPIRLPINKYGSFWNRDFRRKKISYQTSGYLQQQVISGEHRSSQLVSRFPPSTSTLTACPSYSSGPNFVPNVDDINNVEKVYYEKNMNYDNTLDGNNDVNNDYVSVLQNLIFTNCT